MIRMLLSTVAFALADSSHAAPLSATNDLAAAGYTDDLASATAAAGSNCTGATVAAAEKVCDFVKRWNLAAKGEKISLTCTPEEQCAINGTELGGGGRKINCFRGNATMANVLVQNGGKTHEVGGLLFVGTGGSVVGTKLTFRNGHAT